MRTNLSNYNEKKDFIIVPNWNTSTHYPLFSRIAEDYDCKIKQLGLKNISFSDNAVFYLIISMFITPFLLILYAFRCTNLKLAGINIGKGIFEKSLVISNDGVANILDVSICMVQAIFHIYYFKYFCQKNNVKLIILGDEAYVEGSVLCQLSKSLEIPVKIIKGGFNLRVYDYNFDRCHYEYYTENDYSKISSSEEDAQRIEHNLNQRISGIRSSIGYTPSIVKSINIDESKFINADCAFLHDFFDAQFIYGENLFKSHLDWTKKLIKFYTANQRILVLKAHPNFKNKSIRVFNRLCEDESNHFIKKCDFDISLETIRRINPDCLVLSAYGSVIPEALFAGMNVLTNAASPYSAVDLVKVPDSQTEYFGAILTHWSSQNTYVWNRPKVVEKLLKLERFQSKLPSFDLTYDDISYDNWRRLFDKPYPDSDLLRRDQFLYDPSTRALVQSELRGYPNRYFKNIFGDLNEI